ncbi:hypothetical protein ACU8KH_05490 [Lachancea thermotolerans]
MASKDHQITWSNTYLMWNIIVHFKAFKRLQDNTMKSLFFGRDFGFYEDAYKKTLDMSTKTPFYI